MNTADRLRSEGRAEGRIEGQMDTLLRQLGKLFGSLPAAIQERIRAARADDLREWTDRVLDAKSLDDVFAPRS